MTDDAEDHAAPWRTVARGRSFTYLLPARDEDLAKFGFSRDPMQRMRALHVRWFEFFDLERGVLVEFDRVRDARALEASLKHMHCVEATWAPLVIRSAAGGRTEWFRGVSARAAEAMVAHATENGFILHANLRVWLHDHLLAHADTLHDTTLHAWQMIEYLRHNGEATSAGHRARTLRTALDAYVASGFDLAARLDGQVLDWYRDGH